MRQGPQKGSAASAQEFEAFAALRQSFGAERFEASESCQQSQGIVMVSWYVWVHCSPRFVKYKVMQTHNLLLQRNAT